MDGMLTVDAQNNMKGYKDRFPDITRRKETDQFSFGNENSIQDHWKWHIPRSEDKDAMKENVLIRSNT